VRLLLQPTRLIIEPGSLIPHARNQLRARNHPGKRHPETSPDVPYAGNEPSSPALRPQTAHLRPECLPRHLSALTEIGVSVFLPMQNATSIPSRTSIQR